MIKWPGNYKSRTPQKTYLSLCFLKDYETDISLLALFYLITLFAMGDHYQYHQHQTPTYFFFSSFRLLGSVWSGLSGSRFGVFPATGGAILPHHDHLDHHHDRHEHSPCHHSRRVTGRWASLGRSTNAGRDTAFANLADTQSHLIRFNGITIITTTSTIIITNNTSIAIIVIIKGPL